MTRVASAFLFLFLLAVAPLSADQSKLVDDVIRMSRAGVSDEAIVAFLQTLRDRPEVTADEVIAMKTAGVSDTVIRAMISGPPARPVQPGSEPPPVNAGGGGVMMPDGPPSGEMPAVAGGGCVVFDPPIPPFYEPPYPSWIWDPHWYQPRLDANGGTNPMERHLSTPPVFGSAPSPAVWSDGARPPQENAIRQNPARESQSRDSGSASRDSGSASRDSGSASRDSGSASRDSGSASRDSGSASRDSGSASRDSGSRSRGDSRHR